MGASVDFLTGKDALGLLIGNLQSRAGDNIVYVVSRVAEYFKMDTSAINLPDDIMRQLRGMGLLKRLLNKSGMQTRRVTLDGEWYKKTAVFLSQPINRDLLLFCLKNRENIEFTMKIIRLVKL